MSVSLDMISILASTLTVGGAASAVTGILKMSFQKKKAKESLENRIENLTNSLKDSVKIIDIIQSEIEERQKIASQLQQDVETYSRITCLKKEEVEAVAQILTGEIKRDNKRSFWKGILVNFIFFALGAIVSFVTTSIKN